MNTLICWLIFCTTIVAVSGENQDYDEDVAELSVVSKKFLQRSWKID